MSGNSGTRAEFKGPNRRRRKRRSGQGPKGKVAGQGQSAATGAPQGSGRVPNQADTGSVDQAPPAHALRAHEGEGASSTEKRRKKRRRGRSKRTSEQANGPQDVVATPQGDQQFSETATSLKGKKAARRRGRRRWQASKKDAGGQQVNNGAPQGTAAPITSGQSGIVAPKPIQEMQHAKQADVHNVKSRGDSKRLHRSPPGRDRGSVGRNGAPLYAALDLGTNNCRLLIARPEERGFRVVDAYSRIVRLGEGVDSKKRLSDGAMDRAIEALGNCHRKLADRGVGRSRLIATEACRAAENGAEFIERVKAETGLALEVVNRETEARLAVAGCASLVDHDADGVILFDIGGGSSEIVWLDLRNRCGARGYALTRFIRSWISLPVGVVNLAERHGGVHVTPDVFEAMVEDAADHLASFSLADTLSNAIASGRVHMLGTSGTVTTLAGVHLGLKRYDRRRVDGTWLDDHDVSRMIDQLRDMPYEARVENPCIGADRADLVLAGCAILEAIRRRWSCSRLRVADRGLREGILTELMAADGVWSHKKSGHRNDRRRQRNRT
ncbi:MAG: Ppx/GppA family phosphatase [Roseibium sp.]|nr:Ppx/GppA family phosphatase [Roseibium sp.]